MVIESCVGTNKQTRNQLGKLGKQNIPLRVLEGEEKIEPVVMFQD